MARTQSRVRNLFMHDQCQLFALVLHEELKLPYIEIFFDNFRSKNFCHAAVAAENGQLLDYDGLSDLADMRKKWASGNVWLRTRRPSRRYMIATLGAWAVKPNFIQNLALAHRIIRRRILTAGFPARSSNA